MQNSNKFTFKLQSLKPRNSLLGVVSSLKATQAFTEAVRKDGSKKGVHL
jgi:hypothetical protein